MQTWTVVDRKKIFLVWIVLILGTIACGYLGAVNEAVPAEEEPEAAPADEEPEAVLATEEPAKTATSLPTATGFVPAQFTETLPPVLIPVTGGGPTETPMAVSLDLNTIYAEVIENLPVGSALFDPAEEMRQGQVYEVEVRVAPVTEEEIEADEEVKATLTADLETGGAVIIVPVRVSTVMRAKLSGSGFTITPLTEEEQIRDISRPYLRWMWEVRPEKKGVQRLTLHLSVVVNAEGMGDKTHTTSEVREVAVEGNPVYAVQSFLGTNWEWVASGMVLPALGWVWRWYRRRGRPAG